MEKVKIKNFTDVITGGTPSTAKDEYWVNGNIPWLNSGELNQKIVTTSRNYITKLGLEKSSSRLMPNDTVLMALTGSTTGVVGYLTFEACANQSVTGILPSKKHNSKYLYHYLNHIRPKVVNDAYGGAQPHISQGYVKELEIPLPPIHTQQKIAAILDKADELRQYNKQLIEKYDALTQSLFLDMFGDPVRNEKKFFKSTIGEQCSVKGGKRVPKNEKLVKDNTGYPYIKAGNIKKGKVTTKDLEYLLPTTREKLKRYIVNEGDVCITVVGVNIGDIGIVPKELHNANLTENANKLLIKNANLLNSFYLASYLQMDFIQKDISKKTMAVGVPKLALFRIEQLELLLPPIMLQLKFQEQVESIETQKQQAQEALAKSEALFQGLLQQAFKGELN
jgi:type I restriction enzyme S subunit